MKTLHHALVTAAAVLLAAAVLRGQAAPLRLTLSCSHESGRMGFRMNIQNGTEAPTAVVIGFVVGNDRKYVLEGVGLTVRRSGVRDVELQYVDGIAAIAGRVDPWLVRLPPAAVYSIRIPADRFALRPAQERDPFVEPARVRLHLTTRDMDRANLDMQGLRFVDVWMGSLASGWLDVPADCSGAVGNP